MVFTLKIELGDAAMQSGLDVADVLSGLAERLESIEGCLAIDEGAILRDINGNTVGSWGVS